MLKISFSKNKIKAILSLILLFMMLSSCSTRLVTIPEYKSFTDDAGREVTLYSKPQRVAVLMSSLAEVWALSGGKIDITVGETVERGIADGSVILVDDGAGKTINTELLINGKPDFVICSADISAQYEAALLLEETGTPSACFRIESFEDYLRVLSLFCDITENKTAYEKYGLEVEMRVSAVRSNPLIGDRERTALFLRAGSSASSVKAKQSSDHFAAQMLTELGLLNIADDAPLLVDSLSAEEILLRDPEYIFISTMGDEEAAKKNVREMFSGPEWKSLSAVKNEKYVFLPKELFHYKPNARWGEAYRFLMEVIYDYVDFEYEQA